jgi:hypothetical protein
MRGTRFTIGIGTRLIGGMSLGFALFVATLFARSGIAQSPPTYSEAVMQVLDQHGVPYADIQVSDWCPPLPQCAQVGSDVAPTYLVEVVMDKTQSRYGWIACRHRRTDCVLTLAAWSPHSVQLPPLAEDQPWSQALKQRMQAMEALLRAWIAHLRQL